MKTHDKGMRADQPFDPSRRKLLGQIGKVAWVVPTLTVLTLGNAGAANRRVGTNSDIGPPPPPPPGSNSDPRYNSDPRNRGRGD